MSTWQEKNSDKRERQCAFRQQSLREFNSDNMSLWNEEGVPPSGKKTSTKYNEDWVAEVEAKDAQEQLLQGEDEARRKADQNFDNVKTMEDTLTLLMHLMHVGDVSEKSQLLLRILEKVSYCCTPKQITSFFRKLIATGDAIAIQVFCQIGFNPFLSYDGEAAPIYTLMTGINTFAHETIMQAIFRGMKQFYLSRLCGIENDCPLNSFVYDTSRVYAEQRWSTRTYSIPQRERVSLLHKALQNAELSRSSLLSVDLAYYLIDHMDDVTEITIDDWPLLNQAILIDHRRLIALLLRKRCNPYMCGTKNFSIIHDIDTGNSFSQDDYDPLFLAWSTEMSDQEKELHKHATSENLTIVDEKQATAEMKENEKQADTTKTKAKKKKIHICEWWHDTNAFELARRRTPSNYDFVANLFLEQCQSDKIPAERYEKQAKKRCNARHRVSTLLDEEKNLAIVHPVPRSRSRCRKQ